MAQLYAFQTKVIGAPNANGMSTYAAECTGSIEQVWLPKLNLTLKKTNLKLLMLLY